MTEQITQAAEKFREISQKIKALQSEQKPLKEELVKYAESHKEEFNTLFKLPFPNGTYVLKKGSYVLAGDNKNQVLEILGEDYALVELDEKKIIAQAPTNKVLAKTLDQYGLKIELKETLAVYA